MSVCLSKVPATVDCKFDFAQYLCHMGLKDSQRCLRASLTGLRTSEVDLRASLRGVRASQRGLRISQRCWRAGQTDLTAWQSSTGNIRKHLELIVGKGFMVFSYSMVIN